MHHDDPHIRPKDFLYACMRDKSLPLKCRIKAAGHLMRIEPHGPPQPAFTLKIECCPHEDFPMWAEWEAFSREQRAYFNTLPPHERKEIIDAVSRLVRCNELGIDRPLEHMQVKGHG